MSESWADLVEQTARGEADGKAAASWYFDGNTPTETYRRVLAGIEDGDPEILDTFPYPDVEGTLVYHDAFNEAVLHEIERAARYHVGEESAP